MTSTQPEGPGQPEAVNRRRVGDLVEHYQPGQTWPFQPVQEAVRGMLRALALVWPFAQIAQRLGVAGYHGVRPVAVTQTTR